MPISVHSHSGQFCLHAKGQLEDVVLAAIDRKFKVYGLSEHMPRYRVQDLYPEESHITPEKTHEAYTAFHALARSLQEKYASQIQLLVSIESESIIPASIPSLLALIQTHPVDYIVGSVHHVHEIPIDYSPALLIQAEQAAHAHHLTHHPPSSSTPPPSTPTESLFLSYYTSLNDLLTRLNPTLLAHFDLPRLYRPDYILTPRIWDLITTILQNMVKQGTLLEVNARGRAKGLVSAYPMREILERAVGMGVRVTIGDDAHAPEQVGNGFGGLREYMVSCGVKEVWVPVATREGGGGGVRKVEGWECDDAFWDQF